MNYGKEGNLTFFVSIYLDLNVLFKLSKFSPKPNLGLFLGYSSVSKAYRIYNKKTQAVKETICISFKEKKKDINQNVQYLEEDMENLSAIPLHSHKTTQ